MAKIIKTKKRVTKKATSSKEPDFMSGSAETMNTSVGSKGSKNKNMWVLIIFVLLLAAFLYFAKSLFVVAMVNGRPIYRLSLINQLERTAGKTALDSLINKSLIEQAAKKENINVSDADIQAELEKVKKDLEGQGMNLDSALSSQGMSIVDFEENLRMKQTVEKLLSDNLQISDEDVKKYFDDNKATFGKEAKFEELEESIREQLKSEKLSTEFQTWYNKLKEESDIKYFMTF